MYQIIEDEKMTKRVHDNEILNLIDKYTVNVDKREIGGGNIQQIRQIKKLCLYIADKENVYDKQLMWNTFQYSIDKNSNIIKKHASDWFIMYIHEKIKSGNKRVDVDVLPLFNVMTKKWNIPFNSDVYKFVENLKHQWKDKRINAMKQMSCDKKEQFEVFNSYKEKIVNFFDKPSLDKIRQAINVVLDTKKEKLFPKYVYYECGILSRALDNVLLKFTCKARVVLLLGMVTGMRGVSIWRLKCTDIIENDDGFIINYITKKNGSVKNQEKQLSVRIVPHKNRKYDAIIALAEYLELVKDDLSAKEYPFLYGHGVRDLSMNSESLRNLYSHVSQKMITLLEVAAYYVGIKNTIGRKKIHMLRSYCTTVLAKGGADADTRKSHLGWGKSKDIETFYLDKNDSVSNLSSPYIAAERLDLNKKFNKTKISEDIQDAPYYWKLYKSIENMDKWNEKVLCLLVNAGKIKNEKYEDETLKRMISSIKPKKRPPVSTSKVNLKRVKRDVNDVLNHLLETKIKPFVKQKDFPSICYNVVKNDFYQVIETNQNGNNTGLGLNIDLKGGFGRLLVNVIRLGVCKDNNELIEKYNGNSWITYARNNAKEFSKIHRWSTTNWNEIKYKFN